MVKISLWILFLRLCLSICMSNKFYDFKSIQYELMTIYLQSPQMKNTNDIVQPIARGIRDFMPFPRVSVWKWA